MIQIYGSTNVVPSDVPLQYHHMLDNNHTVIYTDCANTVDRLLDLFYRDIPRIDRQFLELYLLGSVDLDEFKISDSQYVGFDSEHCKMSRPACIQISHKDFSILYQRIQPFSGKLIQWFSDPRIIKIGFGLASDQCVLRKDSQCALQPIICINKYYNSGMARITADILGIPDVPKHIRVQTDWTARLTLPQIFYAVGDSYYALYIFNLNRPKYIGHASHQALQYSKQPQPVKQPAKGESRVIVPIGRPIKILSEELEPICYINSNFIHHPINSGDMIMMEDNLTAKIVRNPHYYLNTFVKRIAPAFQDIYLRKQCHACASNDAHSIRNIYVYGSLVDAIEKKYRGNIFQSTILLCGTCAKKMSSTLLKIFTKLSDFTVCNVNPTVVSKLAVQSQDVIRLLYPDSHQNYRGFDIDMILIAEQKIIFETKNENYAKTKNAISQYITLKKVIKAYKKNSEKDFSRDFDGEVGIAIKMLHMTINNEKIKNYQDELTSIIREIKKVFPDFDESAFCNKEIVDKIRHEDESKRVRMFDKLEHNNKKMFDEMHEWFCSMYNIFFARLSELLVKIYYHVNQTVDISINPQFDPHYKLKEMVVNNFEKEHGLNVSIRELLLDPRMLRIECPERIVD